MKIGAKHFLILLCSVLPLFADAANLSGKWVLDVKKSKWHGRSAPQKGEVTIEHNEPKLKYTGTVEDINDTQNTYSFDGAIDGKEYAVKMSSGDQKITFQRLSPMTISSTLKNADSEEEATTTLYRDGKT